MSTLEKKSFDTAVGMPVRLQERLDSWQDSPPDNQFSADGPLNAYLQGHKFLSDRFLVKPQKLLRLLSSNGEDQDAKKTSTEGHGDIDMDDPLAGDLIFGLVTQSEGNDGDILMGLDHEGDSEDEEVGNTSGESNTLSVDSSDNAVGKKRFYPDFQIDQYYGADIDSRKGDVARVIIEIGSLKRTSPNRVVNQLVGYLGALGAKRIDRKVVGIAMLGNQVRIMNIDLEQTGGKYEFTDPYSGEWFSMFDERLVNELNDILELSINSDPDSTILRST